MRVLFFIFLVFSTICVADDKERAFNKLQKAIIAHPKTRIVRRKLEKKITRYIPLNKEMLGVVGSFLMPAVKGYIDTKSIKKMSVDVLNGKLRPDLHYNFRDKRMRGAMNMNWDF